MKRKPRAYAWECRACNHLASQHRLTYDGDLRAGPYLCHCGCEQPQDGEFFPITRDRALMKLDLHANDMAFSHWDATRERLRAAADLPVQGEPQND